MDFEPAFKKQLSLKKQRGKLGSPITHVSQNVLGRRGYIMLNQCI
jgi:hypothetical protein